MSTQTSDKTDLSVREAAGLIGTSPRQLRNEFQRVLSVFAAVKGQARRRRLDFSEFMYFGAIEWLKDEGVELQPELRSKLYDILRQPHPTAVGPWMIDNTALRLKGRVPVEISLRELREELSRRLEKYRKGEALVITKPDILGGEPVFKNTRIPVSHVVAMFRNGVPKAEVHEDYPQLAEEAIAYARLKAVMGDGPGRPRKPLRVSRANK